MESIKQSATSAANYVSESVSGASATAQKEGNKSTAKDSNAGIGERASAATSALGNKADETSSEAKKENAKQNI